MNKMVLGNIIMKMEKYLKKETIKMIKQMDCGTGFGKMEKKDI